MLPLLPVTPEYDVVVDILRWLLKVVLSLLVVWMGRGGDEDEDEDEDDNDDNGGGVIGWTPSELYQSNFDLKVGGEDEGEVEGEVGVEWITPPLLEKRDEVSEECILLLPLPLLLLKRGCEKKIVYYNIIFIRILISIFWEGAMNSGGNMVVFHVELTYYVNYDNKTLSCVATLGWLSYIYHLYYLHLQLNTNVVQIIIIVMLFIRNMIIN